MARRESFLLRIDPDVLEAIRHWAADDLRSVNGQLEWILRRALREAGRKPLPRSSSSPSTEPSAPTNEDDAESEDE